MQDIIIYSLILFLGVILGSMSSRLCRMDEEREERKQLFSSLLGKLKNDNDNIFITTVVSGDEGEIPEEIIPELDQQWRDN